MALGNERGKAFLMMMLAAALLYAAARVATFALSRPDGSNPGRRAIGQWLPIAGTALVAVCMNHAEIAMAVIMGTSVACLSLAVGMITFLNPIDTLPSSRKTWPFVLPAALLVLMAGFSGHLTWWHAIMMLVLGVAIVNVWLDAPETSELTPAERADRPSDSQAMLIVALAAAFIILGGVLIVRGTIATCSFRDANRMISPSALAATIVAPLLILPTLATTSAVAQRGHSGRALTALVGTVLLNLCLLLPIAILLYYFQPGGWSYEPAKFFNVHWSRWHAFPFDAAAWQIETVSLVVLGFGLLPLSMGRWMIGRIESVFLILAYGAYIIMLAAFGVKQV